MRSRAILRWLEHGRSTKVPWKLRPVRPYPRRAGLQDHAVGLNQGGAHHERGPRVQRNPISRGSTNSSRRPVVSALPRAIRTKPARLRCVRPLTARTASIRRGGQGPSPRARGQRRCPAFCIQSERRVRGGMSSGVHLAIAFVYPTRARLGHRIRGTHRARTPPDREETLTDHRCESKLEIRAGLLQKAPLMHLDRARRDVPAEMNCRTRSSPESAVHRPVQRTATHQHCRP